MRKTFHFERPLLAVDALVFGLVKHDLSALLIRRGIAPYRGSWALPGGFVRKEESLEEAVEREVAEEAGIGKLQLQQLRTFGRVGRDPRGRVVAVVYLALARPDNHILRASSDAADVRWFPVRRLPKLAFDHAEVISVGLQELQEKLMYSPSLLTLLPNSFSLSEAQLLHEQVLGNCIDKRNFRKKLLQEVPLQRTGRKVEGVSYRAPELYQLKEAQ